MKKSLVGLLSLCLVAVLCVLSSCNKIPFKEIESFIKPSAQKEEAGNAESISLDTKKEEEVVSSMDLLSISGYRDTDKSTFVEILFSKEIQDGFDGTPFVKVEPNIDFTVSKVGSKLIIRGEFDPKKEYKIRVLSGVKAIDGTTTTNESLESILFEQKKPKIMFTNEGIILPSVNEKRIYIRSLNVKKVNVIVRKVYANNLTQFLQNFNFAGNGRYYGSVEKRDDEEADDYDDWYYYNSSNSFYNVGDELYNVYFDIENEIDTWVQTAIDLTGVLDANGLYMVNVKFDEKGTSYNFPVNEYGNIEWEDSYYIRNNGNIQKTLLLTDIGMIAEKNDDGYRVNVLDIIDNRPLRGVKVYFVSKNNQILEEKTSDADGVVNFSSQKNGFYFLADNVQSKSILVLKNALSTSGFAIDGSYLTSGINGFIYTERGVYRPGDTVYLSIIARNNGEVLEDKQPVKITVYDPTGAKMIENHVINDGKDGFYTYSFDTDVSSRTGIWKIEASIGDQVFNKDISVEAVVPNTIKVNLNTPDTYSVGEEINDWSISANYLFGEPASDLNYYVDFSINEAPIDFPKYKDYTFKSPSTYGSHDYERVEGKLGKDGIDIITPDFSNLKFGSVNMLADVSGRVIADGGRNVTSNKFIKLKKYDTYVGIENTNTYKKPGSKLDLKVICVTEDGENLVEGKKLKYKVYGNDYYWWLDYYDYDDFVRSFKSDKNTELLSEGEIISDNVPVQIDYTLPNVEYVYVEIIDEETNQIASVNLQSSEWVDSSVTKKVETLNVRVDKSKYSVGEVAEVRYKGAKNSKAIITIEKAGKIINQYVRDVNDTDMTEEITITKDMAPNIYVYVTLLQDYKTKENDRPLRLYGIVPINVEDEETKLDLEISAPAEIRPNEKFTVKIQNRKNKQVDFTIAVVDEGLLDITAFKTPSPWQHFFHKLAAKLTLYDNYSEIIDRPYGAINQILKVGGDEALLDEMARRKRLKELGLEEADRFTPVSMFKGVLTTDATGSASVDFEMPNYMGQVRIMVVAANGNSYGSAEKDMIVKAPLIVEAILPRSMKVGDKLSIPVSIFALEDGVNDVEVYYSFKDKIDKKNLSLKKGDKEIVYFDEEIGNVIGSDNLTVGVKSSIYNYEETVKMAINSNNPLIEFSENKELKGRATATFKKDKEYVKGTVDSVLTISNKMLLGLDQRLKYLIKYPYGCAEQTTSSVFPQLFIDKLSTTQKFDKADIVSNINAGISRLKLFQLNDGSFSYWPGDKETSDYATNYIGHFLIMARKNGYYIPDSMFDGFVNYTAKRVRGTSLNSYHDVDYKCYALYLLALAEKPNISEMNYLFETYFNNEMNSISKMYLLAAYKLAGEDATALKHASSINLTKVRQVMEEIAKQDKNYYNYSYGSMLRDTAVYLDCYYTITGKRDDEAFDEILTAMRTGNWYSTQTTAYSLIALSNVIPDNISDSISGVIEIDGVKTDYTTTSQYRVNINEDAKNVKVISDTDAMTYINYYIEGVPINTEVDDYSEGFSIERHYYDDEGKTIDASNMKSGDAFWLEVVVKPTKKILDNIENIALTQILPSGWEIENLRVINKNEPDWIKDKIKAVKVSYTDIRDDRIMWFFDYTKHQDYSFFVKVNAVTKGEYAFPGTTLEAMYDNNYRAYKKGKKVKVQ